MNPNRRVNLRFLSCLVASLVVLGVSIVSIHAYQMHRNAIVFKRQAEAAEQQERFDEAVKYYRLYLGYVPLDTEARRAWGRSLDKKVNKSGQEYVKLFQILEDVLRHEPDDHVTRRRLVDIALILRRYSDALVHLEYLSKGPFPEDDEIEQLMALCLAAKDNFDKARELYGRAIKHAPHHLASYVQLADLLERRNLAQDRDDAAKLMLSMVAANPGNYLAHLHRATFLQKRNLSAEAAKETIKAYELAPDKPETVLARANLDLSRNKLDEARKLLQKGMSAFPKEAEMYRTLARLEVRARRLEEGVACLRKGVEVVPIPSRNMLYHQLALLHLQRGEIEKADEIVNLLREGHAAPVRLNELNARLLMHHGKWNEATRILESSRLLVANQPEAAITVNLLLGLCYDRRGEVDRALEAYRQALQLDPGLMAARISVADALVRLGRLDDALGEYRQALPRDPSVGTKIARLLLLRTLRLEESRRNWREIQSVLDTAAKVAPQSTEVILLRAEVLLAQRKAEEARATVEKARDAQPDRIELWLELANLADAQQKPEKALAILTEAGRRLGDRVELRLGLARHWIVRSAKGAKEAVAALANLEQKVGKFTADEEARLLRGLADTYFRAGNTAAAKRLWTQLAAKQPQDLPVRMALFDLALQSGDDQAFADILQELKALEGEDGTLWRYGEASNILLTAQKTHRKQGLANARQLLEQIAARRPNWAPAILRQAELEDLEGNQQAALSKYEQAFNLGETNPSAIRRAIQLLSERSRYAEAARLVDRLGEQGPLPADLLHWQAAYQLEYGQHDLAIAGARKPIEAGSKDPRDYVWFGQILWGAKRNQEAETILRKAVSLPGAEKLAQPWVVLVQFLAQVGQKKQALAVIQEAQHKLPSDSAVLALAECYEAVGQLDQASAQFKKALEKNPADRIALRGMANWYLRLGDLKGGEPYLRKILDPKTGAPEEDLSWARRGLALRLADAGDYHQFLEARSLLEENFKQGGGTLEDQRTKGMILSSRSYLRKEALALLESAYGKRPPTPEEQLLLGDLYEKVRQWARARQVYSLLANSSEKPAYLAHCAQAFLRHGDVDDAQVCLDKLAELDPESFSTVEIKARVLKARGQAASAAAVVEKYVQTPNAKLDAAAQLFEAIGKSTAAEAIYRQLADQAPKQRDKQLLMLASFLGRQRRTDEALDLCEQAWRMGAAPESVAEVCVNHVLYAAGTPSAGQCERVERALDAALNHNANSVSLLLLLASVHDLHQKYAEAEKIYEKVVELDSRNYRALNNLAWMISTRDGDLTRAFAYVQRAFELAGPMAQLRDTRAMIYFKQGNTRAALEDLEAALDDEPNPERYFHLALVQEKSNNRLAAKLTLNKAREMRLNHQLLHPLERARYHQLLAALDVR